MRFCVLGSGSKGNATYIESAGTGILIDNGFSGIELSRRLAAIGVAEESLAAILITHEHGDHIKGAAIVARKHGLTIMANRETLGAAGKIITKVPGIFEFVTGTTFTLGPFSIHPFAVSHDTVNPVGFVISNGSSTLGYCTDTGKISHLIRHRLASCNGLVLEANHDPEMLRNGPYPIYLQQRVRSLTGHLANQDAADFIAGVRHDGLRHVVLAHLSETNNDPSLAYDTVCRALAGLEAGPLPQVSLAWQDRVGEVIRLREDGHEDE